MYCHYCGTRNDEDAAFCVKCGRQLAASSETPGSPPIPPLPPEPVNVSNYLVPAILVTIFCCWPFGIPAIVYAAQANQKAAIGDIIGAKAASSTALTWCWVSFAAGIIVGSLWFVFNLAAVVAGLGAGL